MQRFDRIDRKRLKGALLLFLGFSAQAFSAGLSSHADLIVKDSGATPRDGVRVTYLGTNGYQFEFKGHALLVDPYFSRVNLLNVALGSRIQPDISRVAEGMRHLAPKPDAILVTHGHFDHVLDVPILMSKTQARLIASASAVDLAKRAGASFGEAVTAGDVRRIGPWKIRVLPATHDRLFGKVPFDQHEMRGLGPPQRAPDWICGEPLAFLIEVGEQRIYIDSGGTPAQLPPHERVDLAILGVALPDSRARLPWRARTFGATLHFAKSPRQFLSAVGRRISIWAAYGFFAGAARLRTSESWPLNPAGIFSAMDTARRSKLQIPTPKVTRTW